MTDCTNASSRDNARKDRVLKIRELVGRISAQGSPKTAWDGRPAYNYEVAKAEEELISMVEKYVQRVHYLQDVLEKYKAENRELRGDAVELQELKYRIDMFADVFKLVADR